MNDPTSAISAPPPRYLLESDSSDEEGQGAYGASSSSSRRPTDQNQPSSTAVRIEWTRDTKGDSIGGCVLGIGQAGRYLLRKAGTGRGREDVQVKLGNVEVGKGWMVGRTLLLVIQDDISGETAWVISKALIQEIQVEKWLVLGTYVPTMYIPDSDSPRMRDAGAPIRRLRQSNEKTSSSSSAGWDSPNYLTGIAATFVSMATNPAFPLKSSQLSTVVLPLPLSGISTSHLTAELSDTAPDLSTTITRTREEDHTSTVWDEMDDEPYSGIGMGGEKRSHTVLPKEDVSIMYM